MDITDKELQYPEVVVSTELGPNPKPKDKLQTEDTGKVLEKAICDAYKIPFDGNFKYSQEEADKLTPRLQRLVTDHLFPMCSHTARKGAQYDFTSIENNCHLSAKSNKKKGGKIAPQVVGQSHPHKFCNIVSNGSVEYTTPENLKKYIQENIVSILPILWKYTFDSQILYYVRDTNEIRFISPLSLVENDGGPNWSSFQYTWTLSYDKWVGSSSLKVCVPEKSEKEVTIMEFQFHTKNRQNMAVRWFIEKVLVLFSEHFRIHEL